MEHQKIQQARGPTIEFDGTLIASTEFETRGRDPMQVRFEIWETAGGALIAYSSSAPADRQGFEATRVEVVECPILNAESSMLESEIAARDQGMRFAVMDHFDWHDRARSMVRKQLKWDLTRRVV